MTALLLRDMQTIIPNNNAFTVTWCELDYFAIKQMYWTNMSAITTATILCMVFFAKTAKIAKFTHPLHDQDFN